MSNEAFYSQVPIFDDFRRIADATVYTPMPEDWCVAVTDVVNSTGAIAAGKYKDVNIVGAATIAAVLNAVHPLPIPFVFGGDGATLCLPQSQIGPVRTALESARTMADQQFGLQLRAGIMPVADLHRAGTRVLIARFRVSASYAQAVFSGGGLILADKLIKDPKRGAAYRIETRRDPAPETFAGLECRWDDIPSPRGETVSLLVRALAPSPDDRQHIYLQVLDQIQSTYGRIEDARPVQRSVLKIAPRGQTAKLASEVKTRTVAFTPLRRWLYRLHLGISLAVARFVFPRNLRLFGTDWGKYQDDVIANSDIRKFDDMLRIILSGNAAQRAALAAFLEQRRQNGELVYGLHTAPAAMMTCLIFNRQGEHFHFVDGIQGGYAAAAILLKKQLASRPADATISAQVT